MYNYIKTPSAKKPASELDPEVWLSADHPRGDVLRRLLHLGEVHERVFSKRRRTCSNSAGTEEGAQEESKRFRRGDVFGLVSHGVVRSVLDIQVLASARAKDGDTKLAEFCTSCGEDQLEELVRSAVAVVDAPKTLALKTSSRLDILRRAATEGTCACSGVWGPAALRLLQHHGEDVAAFCQHVVRALDVGACRGVNMAIIGETGCGKSMIFESMDAIFAVMGKPEGKSTFPLAGVLEAQMMVWHEYKHKDSIVLFEDLLALTVGERFEVLSTTDGQAQALAGCHLGAKAAG